MREALRLNGGSEDTRWDGGAMVFGACHAATRIDDEESAESEAGGILAADTDHEIGNVAEMMRNWIEAQNNAGGG